MAESVARARGEVNCFQLSGILAKDRPDEPTIFFPARECIELRQYARRHLYAIRPEQAQGETDEDHANEQVDVRTSGKAVHPGRARYGREQHR